MPNLADSEEDKPAADVGKSACSALLCAEPLDVTCPGCGDELTTANAGGYRIYCEKCVDAMPELPHDDTDSRNAAAYQIEGKYPDFHWCRVGA